MRKCCVLVVVGFCAGLLQAVPVPGYVYPCSMQAGTTARIIVGGDT